MRVVAERLDTVERVIRSAGFDARYLLVGAGAQRQRKVIWKRMGGAERMESAARDRYAAQTTGRFETLVYRKPYGAADALGTTAVYARSGSRSRRLQDFVGVRSGAGFAPIGRKGATVGKTMGRGSAVAGDSHVRALLSGSSPVARAVGSPPQLKAMVPAIRSQRPTNSLVPEDTRPLVAAWSG